jgi:hypothetical protein
MEKRLDQFLGLSAILTGFGRLQLLGTAMAEEYLSKLDAILPAGVLNEMLAAYERLPQGAEHEAAVSSAILADPKIGPVARNLILFSRRHPRKFRGGHPGERLAGSLVPRK